MFNSRNTCKYTAKHIQTCKYIAEHIQTHNTVLLKAATGCLSRISFKMARVSSAPRSRARVAEGGGATESRAITSTKPKEEAEADANRQNGQTSPQANVEPSVRLCALVDARHRALVLVCKQLLLFDERSQPAISIISKEGSFNK